MQYLAVVFRFRENIHPETASLLQDFRLAVNNATRAGLLARVTSRNALTRLAYNEFREDHPNMCAQHLVSAIGVAAMVLKNYRRRVSKGNPVKIPCTKRLMMKAENQA